MIKFWRSTQIYILNKRLKGHDAQRKGRAHQRRESEKYVVDEGGVVWLTFACIVSQSSDYVGERDHPRVNNIEHINETSAFR